MATIDARQKQFFATTAAWAANDIVLLAGELGFELRDDQSIVCKVGDGVTAFSLLTSHTSWVLDSGSTEGQVPYWNNGRWEPNDALHLSDKVRVNNTDFEVYHPTYGMYRIAMTYNDGHNVLAITSPSENMGFQINARTEEGTAYSLKGWPNGFLYWNNKKIAGPSGPVLESGSSITDATIDGVITGNCSQFSLPSAGAGFGTVGAANLASAVGSPCKIGDYGVIVPDLGAAQQTQTVANTVAKAALQLVVMGMADIMNMPQNQKDDLQLLIDSL